MRFIVQLWSVKAEDWRVSAYSDHTYDAKTAEEACSILLEASPIMAPKYRIIEIPDGMEYFSYVNYPVVAEYTTKDFKYFKEHGRLSGTFDIET